MFKSRKLTSTLLAVILLTSFVLTSCTQSGSGGGNETMVIGTSQFNGVFSAFFGTTAYDKDIANLTDGFLIGNDREGRPVDGIAKYVPPEEVKNESGETIQSIYTFELIDGVKFSDGSEVTADDIIFTYKVYLDPTYTGASTLRTTPIVGVNEYYYDDPNYKVEINKITEQAKSITEEKVVEYIEKEVGKMYEKDGQDTLIKDSGYKNENNLTGEPLKTDIIKFYTQRIKIENYDEYKALAQKEYQKELEKKYIQDNLSSDQIKVPEIEGIEKINDKTVKVTITGIDPKAIWNLGGVQVSPASYYGKGKDGKDYKKGDLTSVSDKNNSPMGAGPYKFVKYENNVVSLESNPHYYLGEPEIKKLKLQVVDTANKLESIKSNNVDISDPAASPEMVTKVEEAGLEKELIDNLGYGYIGINAERVTDINVRKGLMHLMNRGPAIESYYGELATVIERPMSKVSWAYPENASTVYAFNTSKALEYFQKAGYVQTEENGKKVLKKDGKQLKIEVGIGGEGKMDHPVGPVITQMKKEMESLGGVLDIQDVDANILFERLDAGQWDMWVAAWQSVIDPDMYQIYHSDGPSNHYRIKNSELDKLIVDARLTNDINKRKEIYTKALDIIMDQAVEMPVYQRKNMYVYNPQILSKESIPGDLTPFYFPFAKSFNEINKLKLVK